jgi:serine/threonine-protein kinase
VDQRHFEGHRHDFGRRGRAERQRAATRYLTLHVTKSAGIDQDDLEVLRLALDKVVNSLSRSPVITRTVPIDDGRLVYRLNLEDIGLPTDVFERAIQDFYPFGQSFTETASDPVSRQNAETHAVLAGEMRTPVYLLRADWFVATAVLPVPYARFMQFAANRTALDERLGIDVVANVQAAKVVRSGFRNSGVSSSNRIIERHTQANGLAYWISYDFASSDAERSIFANPLGPVIAATPEPKTFAHDGGEIIFQLPNGLLGFYLADAAGKAIDKGPLNIVSHAESPPQFSSAIVNGISCFDCHALGLIDKKDEVRSFVQANVEDFMPQQLSKVMQLYVKKALFTRSIDRDNDIYREALEDLQIDETKPEPINLVYRIYNRSLDRTQAAAELGIPPAKVDELLAREPFKTAWISLTSDDSISREAFNLLYGQALQESKPTVTGREPAVGDYLVTPTCMVASQVSMESCLVRRSVRAVPP